jgi:uncharacterized protein (DUF1800 family)
VSEAARAFTGWHRNGNQFAFSADVHDSGLKRFLARRGKFDGSDVIDLLMAHPATPRFIARKLLRFFAAPNPSDEVVAAAAELYDRTQLNTRLFLRELFQSRFFFSDECRRSRISSPAEYVVGTVRTLNVRQPALDLVNQLTTMGQELLAPPNVKGWDGEEKWINSTTLAARMTYARSIPEMNSGGNVFSPTARLRNSSLPKRSLPQPSWNGSLKSSSRVNCRRTAGANSSSFSPPGMMVRIPSRSATTTISVSPKSGGCWQ